MSEFHPAVKLLLARMDSHPEEFVKESGHKWLAKLKEYEKYFSEEEGKAICDKLKLVHKNALHEYAMDRILNGEADDKRMDEEKRAVDAQALSIKQRMAAQQVAAQAGTMPGSYGGLAQYGQLISADASNVANAKNMLPLKKWADLFK